MSNQKTVSDAKKLGYGYFIAAVIFLCNPYINIVDILPDFFGYSFLIAGLSKWADLCPNISDAIGNISRLRWCTLLKLAMLAFVPLVDDTFVLLFTFCFAIVESKYLFPAIGQIFNGLEYMGTRHDGRAVFKNIKNVRALTVFTFIVRFAFAVIPELCALSSYEYSGYVTATPQVDIANYKGAFLTIGLFFGILAAVIWLINVIPYINRVKKDKAFHTRVCEAYEKEVASNDGLWYARSVKRIFFFIVAGTVFLANFRIDGFNVVPSFIGGLFFTVAAVMLAKHNGTSKKSVIFPALYTLISAASFGVSVVFASRYSLKDIEYKFEAYELYNLGLVLTVIEYVSLAVCVFFIAVGVLRLIRRHLAPVNGVSLRSDVHYTETARSVKTSFGAFALVIAANAAHTLLLAEVDQGWYLAALIVTLVWVFANASVLSNTHSQIEYKYM